MSFVSQEWLFLSALLDSYLDDVVEVFCSRIIKGLKEVLLIIIIKKVEVVLLCYCFFYYCLVFN